MAIVRVYYPEKSSEPQGWFVAELAGGIVSAHIFNTDTDAQKETKAPGIVAWLADPANTIEYYQIPLETARQNFQSNLDVAVRLTKEKIMDRNGIYDGDDPDYFLDIWPEFFEFQRWHALPAPRPARPATPLFDMYANILRDIVNDPTFTTANARGRLRGQLNTRRFKIMAEKTDASGDLVDFKLRQPIYLSMQKEAKQRAFSVINNDAVLTENEKADQIQRLAETLVRANGEPKPFALDDDPSAPIVVL